VNRDYHHLSHFEIGGGKRIYQHLFSSERFGPSAERSFRFGDIPGN
jgi:hypothetical protein